MEDEKDVARGPSDSARVPAALPAGTQPGRVHLVALQTSRPAERLPENLWGLSKGPAGRGSGCGEDRG
jgi:hypothetical protein